MSSRLQREVAAKYVPYLRKIGQRAKADRLAETYFGQPQIHSAPTTQHRRTELPPISQSSPIRNSSKRKADSQLNNTIPKKQKILAAPFPISEYDSDEEVEILEGFYHRTPTSENNKGKGKMVDKAREKAPDEENADDEEEANIAGPSSGPSRRYASDRVIFIAACAQVEEVIREDGPLFNDDEKKSLRQLQETIDGFLGL